MSTILKALRRLEHDKAVPVGKRPLREEVAQSATEARSSRGAWVGALAALVVGAGLGAALLFLWSGGVEEGRDADVVSAAPPTHVAAPAAPAARPPRARAAGPVARRAAPARTEEEQPEGLSAEALASPVEVVSRPAPKPLVAEDPGPVLAAAEPEAPATSGPSRAEEPIAPREPAPVAPTAASAAREPAPVAPATTSAAREADADASRALVADADVPPDTESTPDERADAERAEPDTSAPPAPATSPMPDAIGSAAEIRVEKTLWHPQAERRVAVLELPGRDAPVRVHEGDAVGALVVTAIEPSGVVFTREGERTRRALGE